MSVTYDVTITKDWQRFGNGGAAYSTSATAEWIGPGSWLCEWPLSHRDARRMLDDVEAGADPSRFGLVIRTRGSAVPAFAGVLTHLTYADGTVDGFRTDSIRAVGVSDMAILAGTMSYPNPAQDSSTATPTSWTPYADGGWPNAETAILDLVRENLGTAALARRRFAGLTVPVTANRGGPVTYVKRFPTLLEALRDICLTSGLTVRLDRVNGGLSLVVSEQVRNNAVRWSRLAGTLSGAAVTYRAASATGVLVGGAGEGTARVFLRRDLTPPPGGWAYPRERFLDDTGNSTVDPMRQAADKLLAEEAGGVSVVTSPATAAPFRLGIDYQLGDLTPVDAGTGVIAKRTVLARVDSVTLQTSGAGAWVTTPTVGEPITTTASLTRRLLRDVRNRAKI